jgi:hypothetical protein
VLKGCRRVCARAQGAGLGAYVLKGCQLVCVAGSGRQHVFVDMDVVCTGGALVVTTKHQIGPCFLDLHLFFEPCELIFQHCIFCCLSLTIGCGLLFAVEIA